MVRQRWQSTLYSFVESQIHGLKLRRVILIKTVTTSRARNLAIIIALITSLLSFLTNPAEATSLPSTVNCGAGGGTFAISGTEVTGTSVDGDGNSTCGGLVEIPDGVTSIRYTAFSNSPATAVVIPDSVTDIGTGAFQFMTNLVSIDLGGGVLNIGDYAFWGNSAITTITIPNSVISIGVQAFKDNISLSTINFGTGLQTIGNRAFQGCSSLTNVQLPDSVITIGFSLFDGASALRSVNVPNGVTEIDSGFTYNAPAIESIHIGSGVTLIASNSFDPSSLPKLREITVDVNNHSYSSTSGVLFNNLQTELIQYPPARPNATYSIPSSVITVAQEAFRYASKLVSVEIGQATSSLGLYPFNGAPLLRAVNVNSNNSTFSSDSGVLYDKAQATLILYPPSRPNFTYVIPSTVTTFLDDAFSDLNGLRTLDVPAGITSLGQNYFLSNAKSLREINVDDLNPTYASIDGVLTNKSKENLILYPISKLNTTYTVPSPIKTINQGAFFNVANLTTLIFSNSVLTISSNSVMGNPLLETVVIGDGVQSLEQYTFSGNYSLRSISMGTGVTNIDERAFESLSALSSVSIGPNVTSIGAQAFDGTALTTIEIPNSVTSIGAYAFQNITSLTSVTLGNNLQSIGLSAFQGTSLTTLDIPSSVNSIGNGAFARIRTLRNVILHSCEPVFANLSLSNHFEGDLNLGSFVYEGHITNDCTIGGQQTVASVPLEGILTIPTISFSPTRYGSSSSKTITVKNVGTATFSPFGPIGLARSALPDYVYEGTCLSVSSLAVNSTCTIKITFSPVREHVVENDGNTAGILEWNGYSESTPILQLLRGVIDNSDITRTITVSPGANGSISPTTSSDIADGTDATYTITPDSGFQIDTVTIDSSNILISSLTTVSGETKSYTFTSVNADHTIAATFKSITTVGRPSTTSPSRVSGTVGTALTPATLSLSGATSSETVTVTSGYALPAGLSLATNGRVTGTPTAAGTTSTRLTFTNTQSETATATVEFVISLAAPAYVPPSPIAYVKALTTPQIHLTAGKLLCTPGTYNAGYTLDGVIMGSATALFSPASFTYSLLINGIKQTALQITTANKSVSWDLPASPSGTIFTCSVSVASNGATTTDNSSDNPGAATARTTQSQAITTANTIYTNALAQNIKSYEKALVDNRVNWRSEMEKIQATYYAERDRVKALPASKQTSALRSAALKTYMAAQKKSASDYKASKPAALVAKDAANKAALDAKDAAIAKAKADYATLIESNGFGVQIP